MRYLSYLKEASANRDYNTVTYYFWQLVHRCPAADQAIYISGTNAYRKKRDSAWTPEEKNLYADSLLMVYDLYAKYFGDNPKRGLAYILDRKAQDVALYKPNDRAAIRKAVQAAIAAGDDKTEPGTIVAYFMNYYDDFRNNDGVALEEVLAEYKRLLPFFDKNPEGEEYRLMFEGVIARDGAIDCGKLEEFFKAELAPDPDNADVLALAVSLMPRVGCENDYYLSLVEKYCQVKPSLETTLLLARKFEIKGDYTGAQKYFDLAIEMEKDPAGREKLLIHNGLLKLVGHDNAGAATLARQA